MMLLGYLVLFFGGRGVRMDALFRPLSGRPLQIEPSMNVKRIVGLDSRLLID